MSRKCILVRASKLNWEAEQEVVIEAIGPFDNWDHAGEWREYLGEPLSKEYVIVKLKSAVSKQKEMERIQHLKSQIIKIETKYPYNPKSDFNDGSHEYMMEHVGYYKLMKELRELTNIEFLKVDGVWQV